MSLASGSFWPKAAISPNLQVPARIFCMGWVFCTYRKLIYRKPELGGDFRSLSPPCPTELVGHATPITNKKKASWSGAWL